MIGFPVIGSWPWGGGVTDLPGAVQAPTIAPNGTLIRYGISGAPAVPGGNPAPGQQTALPGASWNGSGV